MNLKEAFRFQNKLQSMMTDAQSILGNNGNITVTCSASKTAEPISAIPATPPSARRWA